MARTWQRPILGLGLGLTAALASISSARWGLLFAATPLPPPSAVPKALSVTAVVEPVSISDAAAPRSSASMLAGVVLTATLVLGAASRARGSRRMGPIARKAIMGRLPEEIMKKIRPSWWSGNIKDLPFTFYPGTHGYSWRTEFYRPPRGPARLCLSKITDPKAKFSASDFYKASFAGLKGADIKKVSSYMIQNGEYVQGATFPTYQKPKEGTWLEQEKGDKLPAQDDKGWTEYVTTKSSLSEVAPKQGVSMDKDFVADRSALGLLLNYVSDSFSKNMYSKLHGQVPMDLVKVSKVPGGKGLYLERIFDMRALTAEFRPYKGAWQRSEKKNHGNYFPAYHRACSKDGEKVKQLDISGIWQTANSRAGHPDKCFRFLEYSMGGFDFLVRTKSDMVKDDGKSVVLQHRNQYFRHKSTIFEVYTKMLLGGTDVIALGLHRSGKIKEIKEFTIAGFEWQQPLIVEVVERRLGRLVALLTKVQEAMADVAEGEEYVLQWQEGDVVLGKYELELVEEEEKQTA